MIDRLCLHTVGCAVLRLLNATRSIEITINVGLKGLMTQTVLTSCLYQPKVTLVFVNGNEGTGKMFSTEAGCK